MNDQWNSLEVARISVSLLTPIVVVTVGFLFNKRLKGFERNQWTNQRIVDKRLEIYDKLVPLLNEILCFHCYIGNWKEIPPTNAIQYKRTLDKYMSIYKPLFDTDVWSAYNKFIHVCFEASTEWGNDATIRSSYSRRAEHCGGWSAEWNGLFSERFVGRASSEKGYEESQNELKMANYSALMECLKNSVEIFQYEGVRAIKLPRKKDSLDKDSSID